MMANWTKKRGQSAVNRLAHLFCVQLFARRARTERHLSGGWFTHWQGGETGNNKTTKPDEVIARGQHQRVERGWRGARQTKQEKPK